MEFTVKRSHLLTALQALVGLASDGTPPDVLSQVLLRVEKSRLCLSTNNLDNAIQCKIPVTTDEEGSFSLPARKFTDVIAAAAGPDTTIRLSKLPSCLEAHINPGNTASYCRLFAGNPDEVPEPPSRESALNGQSFFINQEVFATALRNVVHAQDRDKTRFVLHSTYFEFAGEALNLVSTDGRRLAFTREKIQTSKPLSGGFVLPRPAVRHLQRALGIGDVAKVAFTARKAGFLIAADPGRTGIIDGVLLTSKLVEGQYPKYRKVIPRRAKARAHFFGGDLFAALHRVSLINPTCVTLKLEANRLSISAKSQDVGQADDSVPTVFGLAPVTAQYNPTLILGALEAYPKDEVSLEITTNAEYPFLTIRAQRATFSVASPIVKAAA